MGYFSSPAAAGDSITFKTLADMRAGGVPAANISTAHLVNRVGPLDLAGGVFIWTPDPGLNLTDDDGVVIVPGGVYGDSTALTGGAWVRQFQGPVKVIWFGAKGDGVTDDSAAFVHADACVTDLSNNTLTQYQAAAIELQQLAAYLINTNTAVSWPLTVSDGPEDVSGIDVAAGVTFSCISARSIQFYGAGTVSISDLFLTLDKCLFQGVTANIAEAVSIGHCRDCSFGSAQGTGVYTFTGNFQFDSCIFESKAAATTFTFNGATILIGSQVVNGVNATVYPNGMMQGNGSFTMLSGGVSNNFAAGGFCFGSGFTSLKFDQVGNLNGANMFKNVALVAPSVYTGAPVQSNFNPVSGTVYQNTTAATQKLDLIATFNPTAVAAGTVAVAFQNNAAPANKFTVSVPANDIVGRVLPIHIDVPPGWYYSFTATNAALGICNVTQG